MKKSPFLFSGVLISFVFSCLCFSGTVVRAEDSLLKIQVLPDQNSVKGGMMFLVHVRVANSSTDTSIEFWSNSCSYEKHWVTDNAGVLIQSWTCNENKLEQVTLGPSNAYEKNIILYIPKSDKTEPVTFRLGFKRMSEDGDVAEPLWSDSVTMNVIVPEELKEAGAPMPPARSLGLDGRSSQATSPAATEDAPQAIDQVSGVPVTMNGMPSTAVSEGSRPLVFRDPGVPIRVSPGKEFSILLVSNPSTGFGWKMTLPVDQQTVKFLGAGYVAPQKAMMGAPGEEVYKFKSQVLGETKADFVYVRPWETKTAPTRKIFTILVQEN